MSHFFFIFFFFQSPCGIDIEIPDDITICEETDLDIEANISGDYLNFFWKSDQGYFEDSDLEPEVFIDQTETFTLCATELGTINLVNNGDFESGFSGFTSEYIFNPGTNLDGLGQGWFNIDVQSPNLWTNCSSPDGLMMVMNAATVTNVNVYCTDVSINPNSTYIFSADVMNINNPPPILQFSINGDLLGSSFTGGSPCAVEQFYETWQSESNSTATICVVNQNTAASGNDFALDNIFFSELCVVEKSFTVHFSEYELSHNLPEEISCNNQEVMLEIFVEPENQNYDFEWSTNDGNIIDFIFSSIITVDAPGEYVVTVTDENGCAKEEYFDVFDIGFIPTIEEIPDSVIECGENSITIIADTNVPNGTFIWDGPDILNQDNEMVEIFGAGTYTLTVIDDFTQCSTSSSFEVSLNNVAPDIELVSSNDLDCNTSSSNLSISTEADISSYQWSNNLGPLPNQNNSITVTEAGTYYLTVEYMNGCTSEDSIIINEYIPSFEYNLSTSNNLDCLMPVAFLNSGADENNFQIDWYFGTTFYDQGEEIQIGSAGIYYVNFTDDFGCQEKDSIEILSDFDIPQIQVLNDTLLCDEPEGTLSIISNEPNVNPQWSSPSGAMFTGLTISNIEVGTYTVTVTSQNGCTNTASAELIQNEEIPELSIEGPTVLDCNNPTIEIELVSSLELAQGYWELPNQNMNESMVLSIFEPGNYIYHATGINGCEVSTQVEITIDTISPQIDFSPSTIIDCENPISINSFTSSSSLESVSWLSNGLEISDADTLSTSNAGLYTLLVTSSNGCTYEESFSIEENLDLPEFSISSNIITCSNPQSEITLDIDDSVSYSISYQGQNLSSNSNAIVMDAGIYDIAILSNNGCDIMIEHEVEVDTISPSGNIQFDTLNCVVTSSTVSWLDSNNIISIEWSGPNGFASNEIDIDPNIPGIYEAVLFNTNGCSHTVTQELVIDTSIITPEIFADTIDCITGMTDIILSEYDFEFFEWYFAGQSFSNDPEVSVSEGGLYQVDLLASNQCTTTAMIEIIESSDRPEFDILPIDTLTCLQTEINLQAEVQSEWESILWTFNDIPISNSEMVIASESGTYQFMVVGDNGCIDSILIDVPIDTISPNIILQTEDISCYNEEALIVIQNSESDITYNFISNGSIISEENQLTIEESGPILVTAIGSNGCTDSLLHMVEIDTTTFPINIIGDTLECNLEPIDLAIFDALENHSYNWYLENEFVSNELNISVNNPGLFIATSTNLDNGCQTSTQFQVIQNESGLQIESFEYSDINCDDNFSTVTNLSINGGNEPYLFSLNEDSFIPIEQLSTLPVGENALTIQDVNGCEIDTTIVIATIDELELYTIDQLEIAMDTDHQIEVSTNISTDEIASIEWIDGAGLSCTDCLNPIVNIAQSTSYELIVIDIYGCSASILININVLENQNENIDLFIPNVFTPNDNTTGNSKFKFYTTEENVEMINYFVIYDRWGNKLFQQFNLELTDPDFGWDGTFNGEYLNAGIFVYHSEVLFENGVKDIYIGDVLLAN